MHVLPKRVCAPHVYGCVCRGDCEGDVFHSGDITLDACAAQALPWAGPGIVQAPAKGIVDRELFLRDFSFFCELARRRESQSSEPKPKSLVMLRGKSGKLM